MLPALIHLLFSIDVCVRVEEAVYPTGRVMAVFDGADGVCRSVGEIAAEIDRLGIADNTILIVMGDNGPFMQYAGPTGQSDRIYRGGKADHLREMAAAGLPVPDAVVIPAEATDAEVEAGAAEDERAPIEETEEPEPEPAPVEAQPVEIPEEPEEPAPDGDSDEDAAPTIPAEPEILPTPADFDAGPEVIEAAEAALVVGDVSHGPGDVALGARDRHDLALTGGQRETALHRPGYAGRGFQCAL